MLVKELVKDYTRSNLDKGKVTFITSRVMVAMSEMEGLFIEKMSSLLIAAGSANKIGGVIEDSQLACFCCRR